MFLMPCSAGNIANNYNVHKSFDIQLDKSTGIHNNY